MPLKSFDFRYDQEKFPNRKFQDAQQQFKNLLYSGSVREAFNDCPPSDFSGGEIYITSDTPGGPWEGYPNHLASFIFNTWVFGLPQHGFSIFFETDETIYWYDGNAGEWKQISAGAGSGGAIYNQDTEPTSPSENELWRDTSLNPSWLKIYNGTSWELVGSGDGIDLRHYRNVDFQKGDLDNILTVSNNSLKLTV